MLEIHANLLVKKAHLESICLFIDLIKSSLEKVIVPYELCMNFKQYGGNIALVFRRVQEFDLEKAKSMAPVEREPDFNGFKRSSLATKYILDYEYVKSVETLEWTNNERNYILGRVLKLRKAETRDI